MKNQQQAHAAVLAFLQARAQRVIQIQQPGLRSPCFALSSLEQGQVQCSPIRVSVSKAAVAVALVDA